MQYKNIKLIVQKQQKNKYSNWESLSKNRKETEEKIRKKILLKIKDNIKICMKENEKKTQRDTYKKLRAPSCNFVAKKPGRRPK